MPTRLTCILTCLLSMTTCARGDADTKQAWQTFRVTVPARVEVTHGTTAHPDAIEVRSTMNVLIQLESVAIPSVIKLVPLRSWQTDATRNQTATVFIQKTPLPESGWMRMTIVPLD